MKIHPVINICNLKLFNDYDENEYPNQASAEDTQQEYMVEKIVDSKVERVGRRRITKYLVKGKDYEEEESTWEERSNLVDGNGVVNKALQDYLKSINRK